ncbi:MAG: hypothetical protein ACE366_26875 [Bradymonadia bacterium]
MSVRIIEISAASAHRWAHKVATLEEGVTYPLGDDRFTLDHGADYFAFFRRLGDLVYLAAVEAGEVVAVFAGALREVPQGGRMVKAWYLCDLKVRPSHRGRRLPLKMLASALPRHIGRSARGYGITMNPPSGENRVVRLFRRFPLLPVKVGPQLLFWSLSSAQMADVAALVVRHRGPMGFLSHSGRKDLMLESTGAPMPLLHVQFGPLAEGVIEKPLEGHVHMLCAPEDDGLADDLMGMGLAPSATATVLHHRMGGTDWRWVLTSDI